MQRVITLLSSTATEINQIETEAKRLLYETQDREGYHRTLRQKAILLSGLADAVAEWEDLPPRCHALIKERVGAISFDADRALRLDSVFYMAVLLSPEEYQEGGPNDLEALIRDLREYHHRQG